MVCRSTGRVLARGPQRTDDRLTNCLRIISDVANLHRADAVHLLTEGRALAKIRHDNVVRVLGVESHDQLRRL